jgi:hypothetical protein
MPMYQPPWETNPLEYLVRTKFPLAWSITAASSPHASASTHERARVAEAQAAGCTEELKALPPNELARLAKEAALAGEEEVRLRRGLEENQRFFSQSRADVDVTHWSRMSYWTLDEAVALSLGKDPRVVKWDRVKSLVHSSPFATEFEARREIVIRAIVMRQLSRSTIPSVFLAWAARMRFPMPANLVDVVKALGHQISDWKSAYYAQKKIADDAVAEHLEEQRKHVASIREHASIVAKMREDQETLTQKCATQVDELKMKNAELSARIADLESAESHEPEKPLGARERDSMLKLVIGMAIKGYVYDPKAGRSGAAREIAGDLQLAGLALDEDTIRKYLNEAKELLPPEIEQKA